MRLLRTIRLDPSDTFVFATPAEPGEWAVAGGFMFHGSDPAKLEGKQRQAFRSGFLGLTSFGWSTLAAIVEATPAERDAARDALANFLVDRLGCPDMATARAAADEEIAFAEGLCDPGLGAVIALQRTIDDGGELRERFRTLKPTLEPAAQSYGEGCVRPIGVVGVEGEDGDDVSADHGVDLARMLRAKAGGPP